MLARDMIDTDTEHQRQHGSVHNHVLFNFETLTFEQTVRVKTMNQPKELLGMFGCCFFIPFLWIRPMMPLCLGSPLNIEECQCVLVSILSQNKTSVSSSFFFSFYTEVC